MPTSSSPLPTNIDLIGTSLKVGPDSTQWGNAIVIEYEITNQGNDPASSFAVNFLLSTNRRIDRFDSSLTTVRIEELAAGESAIGSIEVELPGSPGEPPYRFRDPDDAYIGMVVDAEEEIAESDEVNNGGRGLGIDIGMVEILRGRESERNNSVASANKVHTNTQVNASLTDGDFDIYAVKITQPGFITIDVAATNDTDLDASLAFMTRESVPIFAGETSGVPDLLVINDSRAPNNPNPRIREFVLPGDYIIIVQSSSAKEQAEGDYTLQTTFQDSLNPFVPKKAEPVVRTTESDAGAIPSQGTLVSKSTVKESFLVQDVDLVLNLKHEAVGELTAYLIAPDGTRVKLFSELARANHELSDTIFDDDADRHIRVGSGTYGASYRPDEPLSAFAGVQAKGEWTLEIVDAHGGNSGELISWTLDFAELLPKLNVDYNSSNVLAADLNGDELLDLAAANAEAGEISVLLATGDGDFADGLSFSVGATPDDLVAFDFNQDSYTDLAMLDLTMNQVLVFVGTGGGKFLTEQVTALSPDDPRLATLFPPSLAPSTPVTPPPTEADADDVAPLVAGQKGEEEFDSGQSGGSGDDLAFLLTGQDQPFSGPLMPTEPDSAPQPTTSRGNIEQPAAGREFASVLNLEFELSSLETEHVGSEADQHVAANGNVDHLSFHLSFGPANGILLDSAISTPLLEPLSESGIAVVVTLEVNSTLLVNRETQRLRPESTNNETVVDVSDLEFGRLLNGSAAYSQNNDTTGNSEAEVADRWEKLFPRDNANAARLIAGIAEPHDDASSAEVAADQIVPASAPMEAAAQGERIAEAVFDASESLPEHEPTSADIDEAWFAIAARQTACNEPNPTDDKSTAESLNDQSPETDTAAAEELNLPARGVAFVVVAAVSSEAYHLRRSKKSRQRRES